MLARLEVVLDDVGNEVLARACGGRHLGRCALHCGLAWGTVKSRMTSGMGKCSECKSEEEMIRCQSTGRSKPESLCNLHPEAESMIGGDGAAKRSTDPILEREIGT